MLNGIKIYARTMFSNRKPGSKGISTLGSETASCSNVPANTRKAVELTMRYAYWRIIGRAPSSSLDISKSPWLAFVPL